MAIHKPVIKGRLAVPGDKSVTHRAIIFSALSRGATTLLHASPAGDCRSSLACMRLLGVSGQKRGSALVLDSPGLAGLSKPAATLDAGNSGTTMRILAGLLAGRPFDCRLDGDASLRARPMARVLSPLMLMGATVAYLERDGFAPFTISGGGLTGLSLAAPVPSAQVQTALLLAGLQADGETTVAVPPSVRDHTVRMFRHIGVPHSLGDDNAVTVRRLVEPLAPFQVEAPADISSAAFFMVAAACLPGSELTLERVGVNSGRRLVLDVLSSMGADVELSNEREISGEPVADIKIRGGDRLTGTTVEASALAAGIDEIPVLALAGAMCSGVFAVKEAAELRVKESDRLALTVANLRAAGARVQEAGDGFQIEGQARVAGGSPWITAGDHRMAMTGLVASLMFERPVAVDDPACVDVSYPGFQSDLAAVTGP